MTKKTKRKVGRPAIPKEEKAKTIVLTVPVDIKEKIKLIKQIQKFNTSKFFARKIKEEIARQSSDKNEI